VEGVGRVGSRAFALPHTPGEQQESEARHARHCRIQQISNTGRQARFSGDSVRQMGEARKKGLAAVAVRRQKNRGTLERPRASGGQVRERLQERG
jgi:hypothetical protein